MLGSNLATLSRAERQNVAADLVACRIRWECRLLTGKERQQKAQMMLAKLSPEMAEAVKEAMAKRASSDRA